MLSSQLALVGTEWETMNDDTNISSHIWMISILAILAMGTLMQIYRRRATVKFSSDDFLRAELVENENKDAGAAQKS